MQKYRYVILAVLLAAIAGVIIFVAMKGGGKGGADSSSPGLEIVTGDSSAAQSETTPAQASEAETLTSSIAETTTTGDASSTAESVTESSPDVQSSAAEKEYKEYSFRSKKLFNSHYEKHGSEFGNITKEEYLKLANDMLNSDSDTILHKTEKEDGDEVYFDTATGYFLVLSTDGYIRTFFIPDKGIEYYNKQ